MSIALHACTYCSKSAKIIVSIHWTLLSNINFLHRPQILHCFKAIKKYRNAHAHLCAWCSHACSYHSRILKILVSIYLTLLRNFYFLQHTQILYCLKAITKYRNVHEHLCALRSHACTHHSQMFLWCISDTSLMFIPIFINKSNLIWLKYNGLFTAPSCMHIYMRWACMCACPRIILINSGNQSWPMLKVLWTFDFIWLKYWGVLTVYAITPLNPENGPLWGVWRLYKMLLNYFFSSQGFKGYWILYQ